MKNFAQSSLNNVNITHNRRLPALVGIAATAALVLSAVSALWVSTPATPSNTDLQLNQPVQTVTIAAKRWNADQKLAFDAEQRGMQVVVISAQRLSEEQKLAMDNEERQQLALQSTSRAPLANDAHLLNTSFKANDKRRVQPEDQRAVKGAFNG